MVTLLFTLYAGMILLCAAGTALAFGLWIQRPWVTLAMGPWAVAAFFFCIESIVPLGRPGIYVGVGYTLLSGWLFLELLDESHRLGKWLPEARMKKWRDSYRLYTGTWPKLQIQPFGGILLCLVGVFAYAAIWRFTFPDLDGSSEKIPDLMYITSYMAGDGVPAKDYWFAPFPSDQYYSFQHYAASLLGRAFGFSSGMTYNYAFCLLVALTTTTGFSAIATFNKSMLHRVVCGAALMFGGFGVSGIIHLLRQNVDPWSGMRFIGSVTCDVVPLGTWLQNYANGFRTLELPAEPLSYSIYLGDYHAPIAGLYLLFAVLLLLGQYHLRIDKPKVEGDTALLALAGATIPLCVVANLWSFPLQAMLVLSWIGYRAVERKLEGRQLGAVLVGGGISAILLLGYLSRFIMSTRESKTYLKMVVLQDHTPPLLFALFMFPTLAVMAMSFFCRKKPMLWITLFWVGILIFTECFYIKDIYSGRFERFNSVLKWWPWVGAGVVCSLAPLALEHVPRNWQKYVLIVVVGYTCLFAYDLGSTWWLTPKLSPGAVTGDAFILRDPAGKALYSQLKQMPVGLTIERPEGEAFTNTTALSLLAGKPSWMGWLGHEQLWRNDVPEIRQRFERINQFYNGKCTDVTWLLTNKIEYILWYKPKDPGNDNDTEALRQIIAPTLEGKYLWVETLKFKDSAGKDSETGYWVRIH
jgi:uncharacterized membrane protein